MKKAVILDRDGVINESRRPVNRPEQFRFIPGVPEAIKQLNDAGYTVCVATNQGGVGLGYLSEQGLSEIHDHMKRLLQERGAHVEAIKACIHRPDEGCTCRKPAPGMILQLIEELELNPEASYMVGDRDTDVEAGRAAGVRTIFLGSSPSTADLVASNLAEAARQILAEQNDEANAD